MGEQHAQLWEAEQSFKTKVTTWAAHSRLTVNTWADRRSDMRRSVCGCLSRLVHSAFHTVLTEDFIDVMSVSSLNNFLLNLETSRNTSTPPGNCFLLSFYRCMPAGLERSAATLSDLKLKWSDWIHVVTVTACICLAASEVRLFSKQTCGDVYDLLLICTSGVRGMSDGWNPTVLQQKPAAHVVWVLDISKQRGCVSACLCLFSSLSLFCVLS